MTGLNRFRHKRTGASAELRPRALWASTSLQTHGGIATYVRNMRQTKVWEEWNVRHIATHRDGSPLSRIMQFAKGLSGFFFQLTIRRPTVVHIHTSSYGSFARKSILTWISAAFRVPVVLHVHGSEFQKFYDNSHPLGKQVIRRTLLQARAVIALGDTWALRLKQMEPKARVIVLPNAIRLEAPVDHTNRPIQVAFLGEVCLRKGTFMLIEAWARIQELDLDSAPARLVIAGNGEVDRAKRMVDNLGLRDSVEVRGWVAPEQAQSMLSETQILVLPSMNEGQPMAILEAMARGVCVVASRSGGIPDMLDETSGVLLDPLNVETLTGALTRALNDHDQRQRFGTSARLRIQREFDIDLTSSRLADIYRDITKPSTPIT